MATKNSRLEELHREWNLARSAFYKNPNKTTERKMDSALLLYLKEPDLAKLRMHTNCI
ncbi:hypothetical protein [Paenibacillus sp. GP183]|uniref:hypothetical protein n=1 Tax=Paenibacillus sp. GP183 TaxID=1882751 RepID=UPI00089D4C36|nr:hypothetical protein [Paenibacillus sp. GP183]SED15503.1 hypothetical protein SAMN05443246_5940 [Paenibacillus sp. GP183]